MNFTCLIPFYNESSRVIPMLKRLEKASSLSSIICVDDGSTDSSAIEIKRLFPQFKLLQLSINQGKTAAIMKGLEIVTTESVLLLDADLRNLQANEIENALKIFEKHHLDCLFLHTFAMDKLNTVLRYFFPFLLLATGNRIIRTKYLRASLLLGHPNKYQLEVAQNQYLLDKHKQIAYVEITAQNVEKISKVGLLKGISQEIEMWWQIINYKGWKYFMLQNKKLKLKKIV